jgi:hypothetical protein
MYKHILERAGDIDWMALGPLLLFFVFFMVISIFAIRQKKEFVDKMSNLPLEDNTIVNR